MSFCLLKGEVYFCVGLATHTAIIFTVLFAAASGTEFTPLLEDKAKMDSNNSVLEAVTASMRETGEIVA